MEKMIFPMMNKMTESAAKINTNALTSAVQPIQRTTASPTAMITNGIHIVRQTAQSA